MEVKRDELWHSIYSDPSHAKLNQQTREKTADTIWKRQQAIQKRKEQKAKAVIEITRDELWNSIYSDPANAKLTEEIRIKLSNSLWRSRRLLNQINEEKKAKSTKVISLTEVPKMTEMKVETRVKKCESLTMSGKPCNFKAVSECGRFCKKHSV